MHYPNLCAQILQTFWLYHVHLFGGQTINIGNFCVCVFWWTNCKCSVEKIQLKSLLGNDWGKISNFPFNQNFDIWDLAPWKGYDYDYDLTLQLIAMQVTRQTFEKVKLLFLIFYPCDNFFLQGPYCDVMWCDVMWCNCDEEMNRHCS